MKIAGILAIVIAVLCGGFYWYYQDSQSRIENLTANNATLAVAVDLSEAAVASLQSDYAIVQQESQRINREFANVRRQNSILSQKLSESDIGFLAANRPELIERLINRGTENAARCFEILSGANLTQQERNATDATSFNSECPWLWSNGMRP
tara:strand:- start:128 stop:583 length:456 start_codon:yes stop_codon:yes gene_type:complete